VKAQRVFSTPDDGFHYYFGYYDKSPLSADGKRHLALRVEFLNKLPGAGDKADIGYFDLRKGKPVFEQIADTRTFNWQQGAMLQWMGPDHASSIIFNDLVKGRFIARVINIDTKCERQLPMAIYALDPVGRYAYCVDYERHYWCRRGYSYDGVVNRNKDRPVVQGDGIFRMDMISGKVERIIAIEKLNDIKPMNNMYDGHNYVEHVMVSPAGGKIAFLHRWRNHGGIYARLYVADSDGRNIRLLNDSGRMSHFCWRTEDELFGWGGLVNPVNALRRYRFAVKYVIAPLMPLYRRLVTAGSVKWNTRLSAAVSGDGYIRFLVDGSSVSRADISGSMEDGHPSFHPKKRNICITDTYPDSKHCCNLLAMDLEVGHAENLDTLKSIPEYDQSPLRCDLHPKWSYDGNFVSVDTMHEQRRGIYLYQITF
jgi:hypothetical protein